MSETERTSFIRDIIDADLASGKHTKVVTRFPPEPNGYLHIGHAKSIVLNFGLAQDYGGVCHLRFDDTNPLTEDTEYVESIQNDVRWLGYDWGDKLFYASDYFEQLHTWAVDLIKDGKAYVDSLSEEDIRKHRGTVNEPGTPSPYASRSVDENLELFARMRRGDFADGTHVLRARIDLTAANMKMRDPLLYRIRHAHHHRTGDAWCIYPLYDFTHSLSDAIEGITHSICTLEFENNRELYDWFIDNVRVPSHPQQIEFARLNLTSTVMSKRKLLELVKAGLVSGWDDPRMPTLAGLRRRGVRPEALRDFCDRIGVAKANSTVDLGQLEFSIRDDLNHEAPRVLCVLDPLKVVIDNYPEGQQESLEASYWPDDVPRHGTRELPFSREIFIERDDFAEQPPKGWHRLAPGTEVRLRYGYIIKGTDVKKDARGRITELHASYDPDTQSGQGTAGRKVKGTIHWVSAKHAVPIEVRLYDRLFGTDRPDLAPEGVDFKSLLSPESLVVNETARIESSMASAAPGSRWQFERHGYFVMDAHDSDKQHLVANRIVTLRDSWTKKSPVEQTASADVASVKAAAQQKKKATTKQPRLLGERAQRYRDELGLSEDDAAMLGHDADLGDFFDAARAVHPNPVAIANWIANDLARELKRRSLLDLPFGAADLAALVALVDDGSISTKIAKELFVEMLDKGGDPRTLVTARGLSQVSNAETLLPIIDAVLGEFPSEVGRYLEGKHNLLGFFVGQVMQRSFGKANPKLATDLVRQRLAG